jgi:folylpolyglutamate synthase/dihydropteroate synthase
MEPREIAQAFAEREAPVAAEQPVGAALDAALAQVEARGAIVVCGSLFVAAEAREHLLGVAYDPPLDEQGAPSQENEVRV